MFNGERVGKEMEGLSLNKVHITALSCSINGLSQPLCFVGDFSLGVNMIARVSKTCLKRIKTESGMATSCKVLAE